MSTMRLNALTIRSNNLPFKPPGDMVCDALDALERRPIELSRRDLIKVAGTAVVLGALSSTLDPLPETHAGVHSRGAWLRAGRYSALLDPSAFGGDPRLTVSRNGSWFAALQGARFPGTSIPAGIELAVLGVGALSRLRIRHEVGGFDTDVPLASWLSGEKAASSTVRLKERIELNDGGTLTLSGVAKATLGTDWSLRFEGTDIARFVSQGTAVAADVVTVALGAAEAPSLLSRRIARRTVITLERGHDQWKVDVPAIGNGRTITADAQAFDRMTIEAAETRAGAVHQALVVFSAGESAASYHPETSSEQATTPLPLRNLRLARLLDGSDTFHAAAEFGAPRWVTMFGRSLLLGGSAWAAPLEVSGSAGKAKVVAEPAISGMSVPFEGAIAGPLHFPEDAKTTLRLGDRPPVRTTRGLGFASPMPKPFDLSSLGTSRQSSIIIPAATWFSVTRPDDMLTLRFVLFNMTLSLTRMGDTVLRRDNPQYPAYISVVFPGQHVLERAYTDQQSPGSAPFPGYLADDSRLAFSIPSAKADTGIPFSMSALLDWSQFTHVVVPAARSSVEMFDMKDLMWQPKFGSDYYKTPPETSLEVPWGLYLSPEPDAWWEHRTEPLTSGDRTELWHTRMHGGYFYAPFDKPADLAVDSREAIVIGPGPGPGPIDPGPIWRRYEKAPTLRAVWSRHYNTRLTADSPTPDAPTTGLFRNSFTTNQSDAETVTEIVSLFPLVFRTYKNDIGGIKERWSITDLSGRYHRDSIKVNHLMLTSLGAWMDSKAKWDTDIIATEPGVYISTELMQWDHRMTMGRDQYVKIVLFGRIFPFGHKAVKIIITERKVKPTSPFAYLEQRTYIMVREPVLQYDLNSDCIARGFPYKRVELKTLQTPPIHEGKVSGVALLSDALWPEYSNTTKKIPFAVEATDWDGVVHKFSMPLIYVRGFLAGKYASEPFDTKAKPVLDACAKAIRGETSDWDGKVAFNGQAVAYAEDTSDGTGDSARVMPTTWFKFDANSYEPAAAGAARFCPLMFKANVNLDAFEELTNQTAGTTIKIADIYREKGFGGTNATGKVFAKIDTAPTIGFPAELSGALATPIPQLTGISANKGTFGGDEETFGNGQFNPMEFFDKTLGAKIIGGITLMDVLEALLDLDSVPMYKKIMEADELVIKLEWSTPVKSNDDDEAKAIFVATSADSKLILSAEIRKKIKDATALPTSKVEGSLGPFRLQLLPPLVDAIHLTFDTLSFQSINGATPTVSPMISNVEFVGPLKYLQELQKYLGALGEVTGSDLPTGTNQQGLEVLDSGPFKIDVGPSGISASMTLQLPDVTVGVFSLKNMSFFAGLTLPFSGDPVLLDFSFCSKESPMEILVMGFGGGGYVTMQLATDGLRMLEISLEFGAGTSFSLGALASGMVEIKGGLIFRYEKVGDDEKLSLTFFIRIHGSLEILGLITVTLTFYLALEYKEYPGTACARANELTGTATLTIEIEILFFSFSVNLSVTKTLAGTDPRFADRMPLQSDWDTYCAAFAPAQLGA